ncbi:unnamed protein product [Gulo gulo]|uniref:Uncharacterized protein n=1 Tax=Gulo gulo TaxID=48420 RepID=A0A9X9LYU7_GULGU|nr:unnamed protein product [Gulo gulo]
MSCSLHRLSTSCSRSEISPGFSDLKSYSARARSAMVPGPRRAAPDSLCREPEARPRGPRCRPRPGARNGAQKTARSPAPRPAGRALRAAELAAPTALLGRRSRRRLGAGPAASHVPSCANPRPRAARQARVSDGRAAAPAGRAHSAAATAPSRPAPRRQAPGKGFHSETLCGNCLGS